MPKKRIMVCYGTRPEIIKLSPVLRKAKGTFDITTVFSGQHTSLYEDVRDLLPEPTYDLPPGREGRGLTEFVCSFGQQFDPIVRQERPDMLVVQGDTATAYMAAVSAFLAGVRVGHVEAGLRTYDVMSPFPEEFYRRSISSVASINWCPTEGAATNLQNEAVPGDVVVTGNTIVDAVNELGYAPSNSNTVVVTLHRRENAGRFGEILAAINRLAKYHCSGLEFVFPAHPAPDVQGALDSVTAHNFKVVPPMGYREFMRMLASCQFIISDSGGIQEEACCFGKKVIVCRDTTERQEAVWSGHAKLAEGDDFYDMLEWVYDPNMSAANPFGDGHASERIVASLESYLGRTSA